MVHSKLLLSLLVTATVTCGASLNVTATTVTLGSSSCNNSQTLQISSSGGGASPIAFTVGVNYSSSDSSGNWLYASIANSGATSTGTTFQSSTGATGAGVALTIGLNRSPGATSETAQVILIDAGNPGDTVAITVSYAQNNSCGGNTGSASNGFITVTPGSVSLTAAGNGQQSQAVSIQNTTGAGTTFGYSVVPDNTWLSASANTTVLAANSPAQLTITADATMTAGPGTYNGILTITPQSGFGTLLNIPIPFVVTGGSGSSGGTLTINGATDTTYTTSFRSVAPTIPGAQCIAIQDTAAGANSYTTQVATASGGNWLLANNQTSGTTVQLLAPQYQACVGLQLSSAAQSLTSGVYQGSVLITSSSGSQATILVNLYVSAGVAPGIIVTPGPIFSFANIATNSAIVQQQSFAVTASQGSVLGTAALTNGANGFSMSSPIVSNNTETFTVTSNSTGLDAGIYSTTVTVVSSIGSSTNTTTITITLPVGQGGTSTTGNGTTTVAPTALTFQQQQGSTFWASGQEAQQVAITGAEGTQWSAAIVYDDGFTNWLDLPSGSSGTFGSGPTILSVDLFNGIGTLTASSSPYRATIHITTPDGTHSVAVSLVVTGPTVPVLLGLPASATSNATTGASIPDQTVQIVGTDNVSSATNPPITVGTASATWLTATSNGNSMTISVSAGDQGGGVYSATIPVTASAYANPVNYPVILVVNRGVPTAGQLTLSSTSLTYNNVTAQTSQNLNVTASSATNFTASTIEGSCTNQTWLSIANGNNFTATTSDTRLQVSVNPAGIANGSICEGVVNLLTPSAIQLVSVTMAVGITITSGNVTVSANSLNFSYTQNQTAPAAQYVTVVNAASGTASTPFSVTTTENNGTSVNWLQTNATTGTTPMNSPGLGVSVAPGSLTPGLYTGTVTITPYGGTLQTVTISLTVGPLPALTVTESHTGNFVQGQTSATYSVTVSNSGATSTPDLQSVSVRAVLPAGLTLVSMSGFRWMCLADTCFRLDSLPAGGSYPAITVTVNVANNAAPSVTNQVNLFYSGLPVAQTSDPTTILSPCALTNDGTAGSPDVQKVIAEALGINQALDDLNLDGTVNAIDVQAVIAAARGVGCFAGAH
jgi:hypothetical protein